MPMHCECAEESKYEHKEPDANVTYCEIDDSEEE